MTDQTNTCDECETSCYERDLGDLVNVRALQRYLGLMQGGLRQGQLTGPSTVYKRTGVSYVTRDNDDNSQTVAIDVPGVRREDLKIVIKLKNVFIEGNRDGVKLGPIVINVPVHLDAESASAKLEDGVLSVTFQPLPERVIEIG